MTEQRKKPPLSREEIDQLREDLMVADTLTRIENTLMVLSGKGGVGKSTVAVNLAAALAASDKQVGLLDIDIHGPSVPTLLKLEGTLVRGTSERGLIPVRYSDNLKVLSIEFVLKDQAQEAVIWRGPMKHQMIKQFIGEADWGDLDFLIVDAPPGTGDEPLSICQMAPPRSQAVIVTTPQKLAVKDVKKSIRFCRALGMPIFGIIENMSGFVCPNCGTEHQLFKSGGGKQLALETGFRFLGRIPIDPRMVVSSDEGRPFVLEHPTSPAAKAFDEIVLPMLALAPPKLKKH
jgi:ATP-binding protein involved in chromosome partitioning